MRINSILFDFDPSTGEATGTIHRFCSPACRLLYQQNHGDKDIDLEKAWEENCPGESVCETCLKDLG